jgi:hypothetical protein
LFVAALAIVYGAVIWEVAHADYSLVDDYRAFTLLHNGEAGRVLMKTITDWSATDAWLYRPFPDAISYTLAATLKAHPGVWRVLLILIRLGCIAIVFGLARASASSLAAACAAAAYFACFPALPELHLLRVEGWLTAFLAIVMLGWITFERGAHSDRRLQWLTAIAFVAATMSKEIMAPILMVFLVLLARHYWRRSRTLLVVMSAALLFQLGRFLLIFTDPYARGGGSGGGVMRLAKNAFWVSKSMLLAATSFPLLSLALVVWIAAGLLALRRQSRVFAIGILVLLALALAMAVVAPYSAIRYVYPAALLLVPLLAIGFPPRAAWASVMVIALALFGGAQLVAQAASTRACSRADHELLREQASALAAGHDVLVVDDADFERGLWMRAELAGVDPRWAFLTYVAQQYERDQPVVWPPPPAGPVNLTRLVSTGGRFRNVRPTDLTPVDAFIVDANPLIVPRGYCIVRRIDFRNDDRLIAPLVMFGRAAHLINPKFHFAYDLGEMVFPGYSWAVLKRNP